ncbi:hypothetical protein Hanom_Chr05g00389321 [Helianthus anomalus]
MLVVDCHLSGELFVNDGGVEDVNWMDAGGGVGRNLRRERRTRVISLDCIIIIIIMGI